MSIWQWIYDRRQDALMEGDETRIEMVHLFWKMLDTLQDNPERGLYYGQQARRLAELVDDKWFVQLINHWELQARFSFLGDYTGTLDLATKSTVEVRLPAYQAFPQRVCLHEDLISAYVQQDPIGNRERVQQALDYMEQEVEPPVECFRCLNILKLDFVNITGTPEATIQTAQKALQAVNGSAFHLTDIYIILVEVAYEQKDWDRLLQWSIEVERNARESGRENRLATAYLWLALHAEYRGKEDHARSFYQQAMYRASRYGAFIGRPYYLALTAYHETAGRLQEALATQQDYLALVTGKCKPFSECRAYLDIIRLKKALEQPYAQDITALKSTANSLKAPDYILDQLRAIIE